PCTLSVRVLFLSASILAFRQPPSCAPPTVFGSGSDAKTLAARRRTHCAGACRIPLASASSCIRARSMVAQPAVCTPGSTSCCDLWRSLQCAALH
ncbi:hypothetical protein B0H14DRAFT_2688970, partial [Mycena olivaceomarginata]